MRAIVLQVMFLLCIPMITLYPHVGVLMYYWFTWFNPHRLVWGILQIDWGKIIAVSTIVFFIISKEQKKIPFTALNVFVIIFFLWTTVTTGLAKYSDAALEEYINWAKIVVMMLLATILINDKKRLHALIWITAISIGFFGVKGGVFTIISGGNYYVYGPPRSAIYNTNEIARAFLMSIPLMYYLFLQSYYKYVRLGALFVTLLTILALFGTTSRTAFLVLAFMGFFWWIRSAYKAKIAFAGVAAIALILAVLPAERLEGLTEKYMTSAEYDTDNSFQSRVEVWTYIVENLAAERPITGGGFKAVVQETTREPHSNYFQVIGEHGYVGLVFYLLIGITALLQTNRIYKQAKGNPRLKWAGDLALMLQISLIGYFLGGITKNHAFFELYYMQLAMVVALERIVSAELVQRKQAAVRLNPVPAQPSG